MSTINRPRVVPAHLSYLAIYNPSLGPTDETLGDQIVFYYSKDHESRSERRRTEEHNDKIKDNGDSEREERLALTVKDEEERQKNERLRQVGLAQGMVDFVK